MLSKPEKEVMKKRNLWTDLALVAIVIVAVFVAVWILFSLLSSRGLLSSQ